MNTRIVTFRWSTCVSKMLINLLSLFDLCTMHTLIVAPEWKKFRAIFPSSLLQFSCMKEERGTEINHGPPLSRRIILQAPPHQASKERGPKCNNSSMLFAWKVGVGRRPVGTMPPPWRYAYPRRATPWLYSFWIMGTFRTLSKGRRYGTLPLGRFWVESFANKGHANPQFHI